MSRTRPGYRWAWWPRSWSLPQVRTRPGRRRQRALRRRRFYDLIYEDTIPLEDPVVRLELDHPEDEDG